MRWTSLIHDLYRAFNARDTDFLLNRMTPDVHWPNGWEGGYVEGREAVRDYWARQWSEIDPKVEPLTVEELPDGRVAVRVAQRVQDLDGKLLHEGEVTHTYSFSDGLVRGMEISSSDGEQQ